MLADFTVVVLLLASFAVTSQAKGKSKNAADYFNLCHKNDPNLNECVKNSIIAAKPQLIKGISELKLVPLDPLKIQQLEFKDGEGNFQFRMTMINITARGLQNFEITNCKVDLSKPYMELDMKTPFIVFESQYEIDGRILVLPIKGDGDLTLNFTGVRTLATIPGKYEIRDGKRYFEIENLKWNIEVEYSQSYFKNLFNGDQALGESTNKFLNDNWRDAFETTKHLPEEALAVFFTNLGNNVFRRFPIDELYLD